MIENRNEEVDVFSYPTFVLFFFASFLFFGFFFVVHRPLRILDRPRLGIDEVAINYCRRCEQKK